jgi:[ribosomal protein S5]-alanine N-acetyltransferase
VAVEPIRSARLDLVSLSAPFIEALLDGDRTGAESLLGLAIPDSWPQENRHMLQLRLKQMRDDPSVRPWLARAMVVREPAPVVVGYIGFHSGPEDGMVEVGYTVDPDHRRRGYAEEAVRALFDWARDQGVRRFRASVGPWNAPSLALVRKLEFVQTGVQWDELDGEELVFDLVPARSDPWGSLRRGGADPTGDE